MKKTALWMAVFIGIGALLLYAFQPLNTWQNSNIASKFVAEPTSAPVSARVNFASNIPLQDTRGGFTASVRQNTLNSEPKAPIVPLQKGMKRMIIRNATISLQVNHIRESMEKINQLANMSLGYVVNSQLAENNDQGGDTADISLKVPSEGLSSALTQLKSMANRVLEETITGDDITKQYVDLNSQLANLNTEKQQLEKIMSGAKNTQDVLAVYQQLSNTQGQIDVLKGQINYYKESVALSLITIHLSQTQANHMQTVHWEFAMTAQTAYHNLILQIERITYGLITFFIYGLPLLLLWLALCWLVYWLGKKIYRLFRT